MKPMALGMTRDRGGSWRPWLLTLLLACAAPLAVGAGLGSEAEERARITTERGAARVAFEARERECQTRFVVTACVEAARRDQREVLTLLRRQEMVLDETQRRERAAQRLEIPRGQPAAAGVAGDEAAASAPRAGARSATAPHDAGRHAGEHSREHVHGPRNPEVSQEQRRVSEARSTAKFEAASRAAQSRREAVERRNAERGASGKGSAPLPVPAGASAP